MGVRVAGVWPGLGVQEASGTGAGNQTGPEQGARARGLLCFRPGTDANYARVCFHVCGMTGSPPERARARGPGAAPGAAAGTGAVLFSLSHDFSTISLEAFSQVKAGRQYSRLQLCK